jgi:hypothetical protein
MYTTIEADIDNGVICSPDKCRLPRRAHVLITLLSTDSEKKSKKSGCEFDIKRIPHPDLKNSIEVCGDLIDSVPQECWNLPQ